MAPEGSRKPCSWAAPRHAPPDKASSAAPRRPQVGYPPGGRPSGLCEPSSQRAARAAPDSPQRLRTPPFRHTPAVPGHGPAVRQDSRGPDCSGAGLTTVPAGSHGRPDAPATRGSPGPPSSEPGGLPRPWGAPMASASAAKLAPEPAPHVSQVTTADSGFQPTSARGRSQGSRAQTHPGARLPPKNFDSTRFPPTRPQASPGQARPDLAEAPPPGLPGRFSV